MTYLAKKVTASVIKDEYELFATEEAEAVDGSTVAVKKSLGRVRLDQLNDQKQSLLAQIKDIDEKIKVIEALQVKKI